MRLKNKKFYELVAENLVKNEVLEEANTDVAEAICDTIFDTLKDTLEDRLIDVVTIKNFTFKRFIQKPREIVDLNDRTKKRYLPERWRYTIKITDKEDIV